MTALRQLMILTKLTQGKQHDRRYYLRNLNHCDIA